MKVTNPASAELKALIDRHTAKVVAATGDARIGEIFRNGLLNTWETTFEVFPDGRVFVITGDIPAMWLRDSAVQLRPFMALAPESEEIAKVIAGLIEMQWQQIDHDPYANAFNNGPTGASWHAADLCKDPWVWEQKYEIDSLGFPIQLAWQYWKTTGDSAPLAHVHSGARKVIDLWRLEQDHEARSSYRFIREGTDDTLGTDGSGTPVAVTGMTWSGFRPSDDACHYGYNIPAQFFAAHTLGMLAEMAHDVFKDDALGAEALSLKAEIEQGISQFALTEDGVLAYEVNGLGDQLFMDDSNMPSLLSLPMCSDLTLDDELYQKTRAAILSPKNPYWYEGSAARGMGSPHTPPDYIWHISLALEGLTSTDADEKLRYLELCAATDGGTGMMHEGFHKDDPTQFTRPWFSWANSMFCELALDVAGLTINDVIAGDQTKSGF